MFFMIAKFKHNVIYIPQFLLSLIIAAGLFVSAWLQTQGTWTCKRLKSYLVDCHVKLAHCFIMFTVYVNLIIVISNNEGKGKCPFKQVLFLSFREQYIPHAQNTNISKYYFSNPLYIKSGPIEKEELKNNSLKSPI